MRLGLWHGQLLRQCPSPLSVSSVRAWVWCSSSCHTSRHVALDRSVAIRCVTFDTHTRKMSMWRNFCGTFYVSRGLKTFEEPTKSFHVNRDWRVRIPSATTISNTPSQYQIRQWSTFNTHISYLKIDFRNVFSSYFGLITAYKQPDDSCIRCLYPTQCHSASKQFEPIQIS